MSGDFYCDHVSLFNNSFVVAKIGQDLLNSDFHLDENLNKIFNALTLAKALKSFESVLLLCSQGRGEDAAIIIRCIEEQAVVQAYVNIEEPRLEKFFVHDNLRVITQDSAIQKWEKLVGTQRSEELKQAARQFRADVRKTASDYPLNPDKPWYVSEEICSFAQLATYVDTKRNDEKKTLESIARGPYGTLSSYVHSTAIALLDYAKHEGEVYRIANDPTNNRVKQVLIHGVECTVSMIIEAANVLRVEIDMGLLMQQLEECHRVFRTS